ncbi:MULTISPECIES: sulfur carrier protein ThiS [Colwelliaceae]|uniref:sulfur carrier protein ThiS n=1 Tax=Colwelliaceae TaxID=267889 RepID=UPI0009709C2D|nr:MULTISPECIES: sulfur carrier protein ThiS [Colwelliaceae]
MNVFINGKNFTIAHSDNQHECVINQALQQFLNEDQQQTTFAVALNSDFVGRADYDNTPIKDGDSIDVLFPIQGG